LKTEKYCTQNDGDCSTCSLVNYGRDCHNNSVAVVKDGYCQCARPIIYCDAHKVNYNASCAARLDACRLADTTPRPDEKQIETFFGKQKKDNQ